MFFHSSLHENLSKSRARFPGMYSPAACFQKIVNRRRNWTRALSPYVQFLLLVLFSLWRGHSVAIVDSACIFHFLWFSRIAPYFCFVLGGRPVSWNCEERIQNLECRLLAASPPRTLSSLKNWRRGLLRRLKKMPQRIALSSLPGPKRWKSTRQSPKSRR